MRAIIFFTILYLGVAVTNRVPDLSEENFRETTNRYQFSVILFCNRCLLPEATCLPEFTRAAEHLYITHPDVQLFKRKCPKQVPRENGLVPPFVCSDPIQLFVKGVRFPVVYNEGLAASDIVSWVIRTVGFKDNLISTTDDAQQVLAENDVVMFFFGLKTIYSFVNTLKANTWTDTLFVHSNSVDVKDTYGIKEQGEILVLFDKFNSTQKVYSGNLTGPIGEVPDVINIKNWIDSCNAETRLVTSKWDRR